jgi:hypothetical protein
MARVYERPRYINQARNRLLALATHTDDYSLRIAVARSMHCSPEVKSTLLEDYEYIAELAYEGSIDSHHEIGIDSQLSDYLLDSEIGAIVNAPLFSQPDAARALVKDFLRVSRSHKPKETLTDECAMYYLIHKMYTDREQRVESQISQSARIAARNLLHHQLLPQKISPAQFEKVYGKTAMSGSSLPEVINADAWLTAAENIQYRSQPMWVRYCRLWAAPPRRLKAHVSAMIQKAEEAGPLERHRIKVLDQLGIPYSAYNYAGIIVMYIDSIQLIIDNSTADYFRTAATAYRNACLAFSMLRVCGDTGKFDYRHEFKKCVSWIAGAISNPRMARYVARHMHLCYTRWQNMVGEDEAEVNCGWEERDLVLASEVADYYPHNAAWWDLVMSLQVPERVRAEFLKLYHMLPPPDIDPLLLHNTLIERTQSANVADLTASKKFINFCKAFDFCRFTTKNKRMPEHVIAPGYSFRESSWAKSCLAGKFSMPPESDHGKVAISKEFPYPHTGDFHVLDAKDSTRIVADLRAYMSRARSRSQRKQDTNELLSALFNGEILSNGESMPEWRDRVMRNGVCPADDIIAAEAGKAENTKPGKKVRETLSACDTVREYFTEVDHSLRPLAELTPGVSIRMNMVRHKKKFQEMARATSKASTRRAFATSTDISGWSPKMDRLMFHKWQEYALSTTECPNPRAQIALWDRLKLFVDRRGVKEVGDCDKGNIQGWPATSDTTMHAHILIYWAYQLRALKILSPKEAAYTLCLIDDAATVVALEGGVDECVAKAAQARDLLSEIYLSLGFEMDPIKSFFSSIKFVYLNELYIDATQVGHGTKTLMRIDRDHTRRFATLTDNISTAFGTAASAAAQGADPFVAYWMAANLAFRWALHIEPRLANLGPIELLQVALCPVSLNGLGMRPITSVMATGENDHLTWFIEIAGAITDTVGSAQARRSFAAILDQPPRIPDCVQTARMPFSYMAESHQSSQGAIGWAFRKAARLIGMAEPFASLDLVESDPNLEAAYCQVLRSGQYEAALLEEVTSNMPSAFIDQVMARVEKTEIVAYLLGSRGIGSLRRLVQNIDQCNLRTIYDVVTHSYADASLPDTVGIVFGYGPLKPGQPESGCGSYTMAYNLREAMYAATDWQVLNHTYPCVFSLWAYNGMVDLESDSAKRLTTVSHDPHRLRKTACSDTVNMYDSAVFGIGYRGYITARSEADREVKVSLHDPVRRMTAAGLAALRWAQASGAHYESLADLFLWAWAGEVDRRLISLKGKQLLGSAKRLSLRHSKSSHAVLMFLNVQSAIKVDARAITVAQANHSTMYDVMSAITILRAATMLEAALSMRLALGKFAYGYTYLPRAEAKMVVPSGLDIALPAAVLEPIKPFVALDTPMQASARACCSYDGMSAVAAVYIDAGARAAEKIFAGLVREEAIDPSVVAEHSQQVSQFRELSEVTDTSRHSWVTRAAKSKRVLGEFVAEPGSSRASQVLLEMPVATTDDQLAHVATAWDDTLLLDAVIRDAVTMEELKGLYQQHSSVKCIQMEDWAKKRDLIMPNHRQVRELIKEVVSVVGEARAHEALSKVLRKMGLPGFRTRQAEGDLFQQVLSFLGTVSSDISRATHVGSQMRKLRRGSAEEYATIRVARASDSKRTLSKVVRAQWLAAAARRHLRAAEIVRRENSGINAIQPNYEAVYLRVAASLLTTTGKMNMQAFWGNSITKTIQSLENHLGEGERADQFAEAVEQSGVDPEGMCSSQAEAELAITTVVRVAESMDLTVDVNKVVVAFQTMCNWVSLDLGGDHAMTPVLARRVSAFPSSAVPQQQLAASNQDLRILNVGKVVIGEASENGSGQNIEEVDVQALAQWVLTSADSTAWMKRKFGSSNVHYVYSQWSASRDIFYSTYEELAREVDLPQFVDVGYSMFDPPEWEDHSGVFVNE